MSLPDLNIKPTIAVVLSSGGIRGCAHIGVLEELHKANIIPDIIVGSSVGSIIGAIYSDNQDFDRLKEIMFDISTYNKIIRFLGLPRIRVNSFRGQGFFSTKKIEIFFKKILSAKTFEQLKIPLIIISTNISEGDIEIFETGDLIKAVTASCAIPIVFKPVEINKKYYLDAGVINPFPVSVAKKRADIVIGVKLTAQVERIKKLGNTNIFNRKFNIVNRHRLKSEDRKADIIINPPFYSEPYIFAKNKKLSYLYELGKKSARAKLPFLRKIIENYSNPDAAN